MVVRDKHVRVAGVGRLHNKPLQTDSRAIVGALRALLFDAAAAERWR